MSTFGRFGSLLGVVFIGNTTCKFLVYAARNAEVLTCHEIKFKQISPHPGWLEFDPVEIWKATQDCIETACRNLLILEIDPIDIIAIGVTNQRGTTVVWNKATGEPFHNAISWSDTRTATLLKTILSKVKGKTNYVKSVCGLPLSTCFSALKITWLYENNPAIVQAVEDNICLFGTLDSWILWNLTGGIESGVHVTDVTNAAYTMLMDIQTQKWDKRLQKFFNIPELLFPEIRSNSEIYGYISEGPLHGVPIASSMGDQPAALLGQLCTKVGDSACTVDESCFLLFNTGEEIIDSSHGLLSTVAYKLGPKGKTIFALEGAISNAGSSITWLKDKLQINTEINQNDNSAELLSNFLGESSMISSSCSSSVLNGSAEAASTKNRSEIIFVPAFDGLYSPHWKYDARGLILGLTSHTTSEHVTQAAYEATGFQVKEVLQSFSMDTPLWEPIRKLIVGGEFSENNHFMQFLADIAGVLLERPQTISPSCLGTMISAGIAMKILSIENARLMFMPPSDAFYPTTTQNRREVLYQRWDYAVKKCLNWNNFETYDRDIEIFTQREKDPNLSIRCSIPGSIFLTTSFVLFVVAKWLRSQNIS